MKAELRSETERRKANKESRRKSEYKDLNGTAPIGLLNC